MKGMKIKEMKMSFKRFLAFALVMVMVFAYVPAGVFATGEATEDSTTPVPPTVTVSPAERDGAAFAVTFKAAEMTTEQQDYYGNWNVDLVLTVNRSLTMNHTNSAEYSYLTINCPEMGFNWTNMPGTPDNNVEIAANEPWGLLADGGMSVVYSQFAALPNGVDYAATFPEAYLQSNPGFEATVELVLTNPETNETVVIAEHQYESPYKAPELPTATVSRIYEDNLTFAMNFKAEDITEEQLAYYGNWYADFELTLNKTVTFDANKTSDGWLSGRYAGWNNGAWVNVPIKPVTVEADKPLRIMEFAAELMGQDGLRMTYAEIVQSVQDFDCGIFFTQEFLEANPDLKVGLELRMYNPANESESHTVGESYTYTLDNAKPDLPTATVTEIVEDNLTFAMNFKADEPTPDQLACYGKWYADFELTVNTPVTFDANGTGDGWLSGQYDAWSYFQPSPLA